MIPGVIVPAKVLPSKVLARYLERHRLLDETSGTAPDRFLLTLIRRSLDFVPAEASLLLLDDPVAKEDDRSKNDLTSVVELNKSEREKEAVKAGRIVDEEVLKFQRWYKGMDVTPTIAAMRKKADDICRMELEKTLPRLQCLSDKERQSVEKMAAAIISKILYDPLVFLKQDSCKHDSKVKVDMLRTIFGLEDDNE